MRSTRTHYKGKEIKPKNRDSLRFILCSLLIFATACLSCRRKPAPETDVNVPEPNVAQEAVDPVVVSVDGVDITEGQIEAQIKPEIDRMAAKAGQLPPAFAEQYKKQLRQVALERLVVEQLLDEEIRKANISVTEQEVTEKIEQMAARQQPPLSLEELKMRAAASGKDFDELRNDIRRGIGYEKLLQAQWVDKIGVTEDEASKYYSENSKEFETPEQIKASHILIATDTSDASVDPNEVKAKARAQAEQLLAQLKDGADFAELAKANSSCPSASKGGDLGFFSKGDMVAPFEEAAFALEPGQLSDIVETKFGYHIIKVTDHKDAGTIAFEQAKDDVIDKLTKRKKTEIAKEYIQSLKTKANITYQTGQEPVLAAPAPQESGGSEQTTPQEPNEQEKEAEQTNP
jgi:peptidyl-prolyl cis-trans isomerase C